MCRRIKTVVRSPAFYCFNSNLQPLLGWAHKGFQFKFRPANDNEPIECWFLFFSFFFSLSNFLRFDTSIPFEGGGEQSTTSAESCTYHCCFAWVYPVLWHLQIKPQINRTILAYVYIYTLLYFKPSPVCLPRSWTISPAIILSIMWAANWTSTLKLNIPLYRCIYGLSVYVFDRCFSFFFLTTGFNETSKYDIKVS